MNTPNLPLAFLGVPISNLTMEETIIRIQQLIKDYRKDLQPRYIATLNSDFLVNAHSWNCGSPRFPELLHILRDSSLVPIDGMPIVWACRLMGTHVKERVTGADLFPHIAEALNESKQSIFLLGGNEKTLKLCMLYLLAVYPDLHIAGTAHPKIDVEGEDLEISEERDKLLIEQINRANPDILMINLGNPKQEIWYERVRNKIHVPVSIGVGGAFDLLTGMISRAPVWMQKSGLEWLYRLVQEPKRLWKRYLADLFKFSYMVLPLLAYHNFNRFLYNIFYGLRYKQSKLQSSLLFISTKQTIAVVPLPRRLDELVSREIRQNLEDLLSQDALILDFAAVRHIDLEGMGLLLRISQRSMKEKKQFFCLGINADMRLLLRLHRLWDVLEDHSCKSSKEILTRLNQNCSGASFYDAIQQEHQYVIISFFGKLDKAHDYDEYMKKIGPITYQKECILDFSYCSYIDNTGLGFLLKLKKNQPKRFISLKIYGLSKSLKRQFRIAKVYHLFEILPSLDKVLSYYVQ